MTYDRIKAAADFIKERTSITPKAAIILGSGLNDYADKVSDAVSIGYNEIPGFESTGVIGHRGTAVLGYIRECPVIVFAGRFHYYEGHDLDTVVLPVRTAAMLGAEHLIVTNAAGGINEEYSQGALVCITDHINLSGINPLRGQNDERLGERFPDMSHAYSPEMRSAILQGAAKAGVEMKTGVYYYAPGPSYETPAEIRAMRLLGADLVGMSTVAEVVAANHMGMSVGGISCVTNMAAGILDQKLSSAEVIETAEKVKDDFETCLDNIIEIVGKM